ncbi:AraC family transcriptional regulator [Novosphingobium rosa]|uniref:AraC family transcriptional regulator n=1 Tax=Novosphingobium rosa TaxID=76978 RepID=UPI000834A19F|nr:AraC family transcriptional regulator [Novosphingobium rosa]
MDPLSDILSLMKPGSYGFRGLDAGGDWSLGYAASAGVRCYAIHSGQCWIEVEGQAAPLALSAGDFVLLPGGTAYRLYAGAPSETIDAFRFFPTVPSGQTAVLNGGGDCMGVGGYFHFAGLQASRLLAALPPILHIDAQQGKQALRASIDRLMDELRAPRPGGALMAEHLAQALLIEALRAHLDQTPTSPGWLLALADRYIHAALSAMHDAPARRWTLQDLARTAGLSRSSFAARFREKTGETAMDYLTRWRMVLAADRLANHGMTIAAVAPMVGYDSESAFGAAFRRVVGSSPRQFAKSAAAKPS